MKLLTGDIRNYICTRPVMNLNLKREFVCMPLVGVQIISYRAFLLFSILLVKKKEKKRSFYLSEKEKNFFCYTVMSWMNGYYHNSQRNIFLWAR